MNLKALDRDMETFSIEMTREFFENHAGLKDDYNTSAIFERHRQLSSKELYLELRRRGEKEKGERKRLLKFTERLVASNYLEMAVKELTDKVITTEARTNLPLKGEKISYRYAPVMIMNEEERGRRRKLFEAQGKAMDKLNPLLLRRMETLHGYAMRLGFANYTEMYRETKEIDFEGLDSLLQRFLSRTEKLYRDRFGTLMAEKAGIELKEAEKFDIAYLFRAKDWDRYFTKERMMETFDSALKKMGIVLAKQKNIIIDAEVRERKSPRAFVAPIRVPDEVRLVVMPHGGKDDYETLFHEGGHAEHFANVSKRIPAAYRYLGDNSVTESYAFLLQYLMGDELWAKRFFHIEDREMKDYLNFLYCRKLYFLRRYSGKLQYEMEMHKGKVKGGERLYAEKLEKALLFKHPKNHYLTDLDDGFYCAQYLRAWLFESQLKAVLKGRCGREWFSNKKSGEFLRGLWKVGQKYNVDEMAKMLGYSGLDVKPVEEEIRSYLE